MPDNSRCEHASTYFVQDRDNQQELARLQALDRLATQSIGGLLPEQPDPSRFKRVLDIGCGTGGWLIETAKTYPDMTQLFGIDISGTISNYARSQAEAHQVSDRVEFVVMDALRMLEFPNSFFDLVNMRFGQSFLRTWDWPKLLQEALRVSKPGGVIRFTEGDFGANSSSQAYNRLADLGLQAFHQAGHYFTPDGNGAAAHLPRLMHQYGVRNIQTRACTAEHRANTPEGALFTENVRIVCRTSVPFMRKWIRLPDDYEDIYQQALVDMLAPDFIATWNFLTAWGNK